MYVYTCACVYILYLIYHGGPPLGRVFDPAENQLQRKSYRINHAHTILYVNTCGPGRELQTEIRVAFLRYASFGLLYKCENVC